MLVDRGTCSFSLKIANIAGAGGMLGIIGLITADAPFGGAFGGGTPTIPGFMINQADANVLRAGNARGALLAASLVSAGRIAGVDVLAWSALRRQHRQA